MTQMSWFRGRSRSREIVRRRDQPTRRESQPSLDPSRVRKWTAFRLTSDAAHGIGTLFLGSSMALAGATLLMQWGLRSALGWIAIVAGALTLATLLTAGTSFAALGGALFVPALALTVVFRFGAGVFLWRHGVP
jgi:hypothetical protein